MCSKEGKQKITFTMILQLVLHEKQPPETVTGFKLAETYHSGYMDFLKCSCFIKQDKENPYVCMSVCVCDREINVNYSIQYHSASVPLEAY